MKKTILYLSLCVISLLATVSCTPAGDKFSPEQQTFLSSATLYGAYNTKGNLFIYDSQSKQWGERQGASFGYEVKFQDDDMESYFILKMDEAPATAAQTLTADVKVGGISGLENAEEVSFKVLKIENGKVWLWSDDKDYGFVVPKASK